MDIMNIIIKKLKKECAKGICIVDTYKSILKGLSETDGSIRDVSKRTGVSEGVVRDICVEHVLAVINSTPKSILRRAGPSGIMRLAFERMDGIADKMEADRRHGKSTEKVSRIRR
jgi:hypothetical protein